MFYLTLKTCSLGLDSQAFRKYEHGCLVAPVHGFGSSWAHGISVHFLSHFPAERMDLVNAVLPQCSLDLSAIRTSVSG